MLSKKILILFRESNALAAGALCLLTGELVGMSCGGGTECKKSPEYFPARSSEQGVWEGCSSPSVSHQILPHLSN